MKNRNRAAFADFVGEKAPPLRYAQLNLTAVVLEGDAVLHTGFGVHMEVPAERQCKAHRQRREQIKLSLVLLLGVCIGWLIHY